MHEHILRNLQQQELITPEDAEKIALFESKKAFFPALGAQNPALPRRFIVESRSGLFDLRKHRYHWTCSADHLDRSDQRPVFLVCYQAQGAFFQG